MLEVGSTLHADRRSPARPVPELTLPPADSQMHEGATMCAPTLASHRQHWFSRQGSRRLSAGAARIERMDALQTSLAGACSILSYRQL